jgi:hypothetical protein
VNDEDTTIVEFIQEALEDNYQILRHEVARSLTPDGKAAALRQVLLYWRRMRHVAESITDTEVKLSLPNQHSPGGYIFSINGVVDIVRDDERTIMYDLKTHDESYVRAHKDFYEEQLNVYAHIWQELRDEPLDKSAVIATQYPRQIAQALEAGDEEMLASLLEGWDPLVPIPFDQEKVAATIAEFGQVVDAIEDGDFDPPPLSKLREKIYRQERQETFATRTCRQCDARFTCDTYRQYLRETYGSDRRTYRRYLEDMGTDEEREVWRTANLDSAPTTEELDDMGS